MPRRATRAYDTSLSDDMLLLDLSGDDAYEGTDRASNGGGSEGGTGLLLDAATTDINRDAVTDCQDCTLAPKERAGAQIDPG